MLPVLALLFLVVPIAELAVILRVGREIGAWNTIGLLVAVSVAGAWLVKRVGTGVARRFARQVRAGVVPGQELADAVMVLLSGALLLTPGFLTDALALVLLLPPVRAGVRRAAFRRLTGRLHLR